MQPANFDPAAIPAYSSPSPAQSSSDESKARELIGADYDPEKSVKKNVLAYLSNPNPQFPSNKVLIFRENFLSDFMESDIPPGFSLSNNVGQKQSTLLVGKGGSVQVVALGDKTRITFLELRKNAEAPVNTHQILERQAKEQQRRQHRSEAVQKLRQEVELVTARYHQFRQQNTPSSLPGHHDPIAPVGTNSSKVAALPSNDLPKQKIDDNLVSQVLSLVGNEYDFEKEPGENLMNFLLKSNDHPVEGTWMFNGFDLSSAPFRKIDMHGWSLSMGATGARILQGKNVIVHSLGNEITVTFRKPPAIPPHPKSVSSEQLFINEIKHNIAPIKYDPDLGPKGNLLNYIFRGAKHFQDGVRWDLLDLDLLFAIRPEQIPENFKLTQEPGTLAWNLVSEDVSIRCIDNSTSIKFHPAKVASEEQSDGEIQVGTSSTSTTSAAVVPIETVPAPSAVLPTTSPSASSTQSPVTDKLVPPTSPPPSPPTSPYLHVKQRANDKLIADITHMLHDVPYQDCLTPGQNLFCFLSTHVDRFPVGRLIEINGINPSLDPAFLSIPGDWQWVKSDNDGSLILEGQGFTARMLDDTTMFVFDGIKSKPVARKLGYKDLDQQEAKQKVAEDTSLVTSERGVEFCYVNFIGLKSTPQLQGAVSVKNMGTPLQAQTLAKLKGIASHYLLNLPLDVEACPEYFQIVIDAKFQRLGFWSSERKQVWLKEQLQSNVLSQGAKAYFSVKLQLLQENSK